MSLISLKISHFRTHKLSFLEPANQPIVLFGLNGTGKTNVLEAVSMFAPGQGFRRAKFADLNRRPELLGWKLTGEFKSPDSLFEIVTSWDESSGRKVLINGKLATQSELGRLVRILWITPVMDRIWLEGSLERRRFIDRIVSNLIPNHTENIIQYYRALKQRNRLIKNNITDWNWYDSVEKQMALFGVKIEEARLKVVDQITKKQKNSISAFPVAKLYLVGSSYLCFDEFLLSLSENRKKDIHAGRTLLGPHLSDLGAIFEAKGIEAKNCSTGEQKALLISIVIATAKIQIELFKTSPILLLDEVSAHLDAARRTILYEELNNLNSQVFLTGTDCTIFEELKGRAKYYEVILSSSVSICKPSDTLLVKNFEN